jgi:putative aldouronate transport system substrate-binding protein
LGNIFGGDKMKIMVVAFLFMAAAVCSLYAGGGSDRGGTSDQGVNKLSIMIPIGIPETPTRDAPVWQALERIAGVTLDLQFSPSDSYWDKQVVSIASNTLPHVFVVADERHNVVVNAAQGGMFWQVNDAIAKSKNISKNLDPRVLQNAATFGKNYHIPRTRVLARNGFTYRKDWLKKLGIPVPKTVDDVISLARAFTTRDPDGNGKDDTFGFIIGVAGETAGNLGGAVSEIALLKGMGNAWVEQNNQLIPGFMTEPYIDTLVLFNQLYKEKVVNQDFATINSSRVTELLNAERGGIFMGNVDDILHRFDPLISAKKAENPNIVLGDLWDFAPINSVTGEPRMNAGAGYYRGFVFSKTALKTEAEFQAAFDVFDRFDSDEAKIIFNWGVEGRNYEIRNGKAYIINENTWQRDVQPFVQLAVTADSMPGSLKGEKPDLTARIEAYQAEYPRKYGVMNPAVSLASATDSARGQELGQLVADASIRLIMGQIDRNGYQAVLNQWLAQGGQAIINEYTQAWLASK